ncbi:MAG: glycoside hydrolase family 57, partial [Candidatus Omnitrophica bacterium]|nr:glycoside hydrolase family 57 [Candidatus Omnitrophota bacterium]
MSKLLHVAFVWHMHQPYYKDNITKEVSMPWVRLHAIKDYLDMVEILDDFPSIHQTFNLVPSLIDQIEDWTKKNNQTDTFLELSRKKASELNDNDKDFILLNFFMANWKNMVRVYPRYNDLLHKRGRTIDSSLVEMRRKRFSIQDFLDLQVWFNLAWFDPIFTAKDHVLKKLVKKGQYYTEEDKTIVLNKQLDTMAKILPTYKKLQDTGRIEVTVSPYYHPILPLICDIKAAKESSADTILPNVNFSHPEDASHQIKESVRRYREVFGMPPRGMWPPEGAVSESIVPLLQESGIEWIAADESILLKSLNKQREAKLLYKPYVIERGGKKLSIIFRDHNLSDMIGFDYSTWRGDEAASDLIKRLHGIRNGVLKEEGEFLVTILLDGENAWEYYPEDGRDFLTNLYRNLENDPKLKAVTVSEFLKGYPDAKGIDRLFPGSWINSNFKIWIGHPEKNLSWEYLAKTREYLVKWEMTHTQPEYKEEIKKAWEEIYIDEGSDWNWWYGDDHSSAMDDEFDRLYRKHLSNVYEILKEDVPDYLHIPIKSEETRPVREPTNIIRPVIDGLVTDYYEWLEAGSFDTEEVGGTMHRSQGLIKRIYYGFDLERLYMRFDITGMENGNSETILLALVVSPSDMRIEIPIYPRRFSVEAALMKKDSHDNWGVLKNIKSVAFDKILEIGLNFS